MTRIFVGLALCAALAACGAPRNDRNYSRSYGGGSIAPASASGQISNACMASGRKAANPRLCGCIQAVANSSLRGGGDQSMAASFFKDPHQAQVIRQSDNPRHEDFWQRYKAFTSRAEATCKGL